MENQLTNNELIYLLLDGEATHTERARIFDAMAKDSELQDEFDRAVKLKNAFEHEVRDTKPAPLLTGVLFSKLGFTTLGAGSGVAVGTAIKTGWLPFASKLAVPVVTALLGSAVTYYAVTSGSSSSANENSLSRQGLVAQKPEVAQNEVTAPQVTNQAPHASSTQTDRESGTRTIVKTVYVPSAVVHDTVIIEKTVNVPSSNVNSNPNEVAVKEVTVPPVTPDKQVVVQEPVKNISDKPETTISQLREEKETGIGDIFVGARGMTMLKLFPSREVETSERDLINNLSVSVRYNLTNNHSFGVEGGSETFPISVVSSDGTIEKKTSLLWGGMFYRFTTDPFVAIGGLQLFGQVLGGGTVSGPMGKLTTGMVWQPDSRVELMLGVEGMMQSYRYNGDWGHGEKISITTGVAVRF
jgi:hypothetical protein